MTLDQTTPSYWPDKNMEEPDWWELLVSGDYGDSLPNRGEIFSATVLAIGEHDIIVDVGGKRDGIIQERDLVNVPPSYLETLEVGQEIPVRVISVRGEQGAVVVSLKQGLEHQDWLDAEALMESEQITQVQVSSTNRGGVVADFGRIPGFVPNSHLSRIPRGLRGDKRNEMKEALVGETIDVVIIEVDARRRRLILSERLAAARQRSEVLADIHEGAIQTGFVSNIVDFGAFIDLGGVDGLLHISEISWDHVENPGDVLSIGEQLEVYVLDVDRERERIALSRKRLLPDPWETLASRLGVGDVVEGTVSHTADFGAFIDVGRGVEGLAHVSEMPRGEQTLTELVPHTTVEVEILHIDTQQRRVSLRIVDDPNDLGDAEVEAQSDPELEAEEPVTD